MSGALSIGNDGGPAATRLCAADDLVEGIPLRLDCGERQLILVRHGGAVLAYINSCPHLGIELDWLPGQFLDHSGQHLQCSTHGARFRMGDGFCIAGPCHGRSLTAVAIEERDGGVWAVLPAG